MLTTVSITLLTTIPLIKNNYYSTQIQLITNSKINCNQRGIIQKIQIVDITRKIKYLIYKIMNNKIIIQIINDKLNVENFCVLTENDALTDIKLNYLPHATIKEIKSSFDNVQEENYQVLHYEVILIAKDTITNSQNIQKKFSYESLKYLIFDILKEILKSNLVTRVNLEKLTAQKAKYTLQNEISVKAEFNVNTIYSKI